MGLADVEIILMKTVTIRPVLHSSALQSVRSP